MNYKDIQALPFNRMWKERHPESLDETRSFWEKRANEFNDITRSKDKEERLELIGFLEQRGALKSDFHVLDLGCGAGRHALEFADRTGYVTGIDISPKMIAYAKENAVEAGARNTSFEVAPWEELVLDARNWEQAFDLVFASMSPAIHNQETLLKFHQASRGHCFMNGFIERTDLLQRRLAGLLFPDLEWGPYEGSIYFAFNVLWQQGIHADVLCKHTGWTNDWDVETAINNYLPSFRSFAPPGMDVECELRRHLHAEAREGRLLRETQAETAWLYWRV